MVVMEDDVKVDLFLSQSEYDKASIVTAVNKTPTDEYIAQALMHGGMQVPHGYQELRLTQFGEEMGGASWPGRMAKRLGGL